MTCLCLSLWFSIELRELESKLKSAYLNRERAAQIAEKEAMRYETMVRAYTHSHRASCHLVSNMADILTQLKHHGLCTCSLTYHNLSGAVPACVCVTVS